MQLMAGDKSNQMTIVLEETLTADMASAFKRLVQEALAANPKDLVLDCSSLTYIDSTGLGLLTLARGEAMRNKCNVSLDNVNHAHTKKVLQLVKFDKLFKITE